MLGLQDVSNQPMDVTSLRRATAEERRNYEPLPECTASFILKIKSKSDVERLKLLPPGFDIQVFLRVLQIVHEYDTAPGLLIILHLPETKDQARVDLKRANPGVSHAWKVSNYNVTRHQFTPAMLETWSRGGAVLIHACTGAVLDVGAKLLEDGESTISVPGGTKNNTALKCSIHKNTIALVKKLKNYKDAVFDSVPDPRAALDPSSSTGTLQSLPTGIVHVKHDFPKLHHVCIFSPRYTRDCPSQYLTYDLQRQFDIRVADEESSGVSDSEPIDVSDIALEKVDDVPFWEIAAISMDTKHQLKAEVEWVSSPWSSEADIPDHVMPEGFPKVLLLRLFDLLDRLSDDALVVVGPVDSLPLDKMCSHPKRAQQWRKAGFEALNIFQDFDATALQEWTLNGAVCVHHAGGDVIDITVKLLQSESIRWYIEGGFRIDAALKCATLSSPCVALCRAQPGRDDPTPPYILLCSSQQCSEKATGWFGHGLDRKAHVWKLPCGNKEKPRIDQPTLREIQKRLRLQEFDLSSLLPGVPDQAAEALPASVAWNESSWCTESHEARNDAEQEDQQEDHIENIESSTADVADLADLAAIQASQMLQFGQQLVSIIEDKGELSAAEVLRQLQDLGCSSNKLRQVYTLNRLDSTGLIFKHSLRTLGEDAFLQTIDVFAALLDLHSQDASTQISTLESIRQMPRRHQEWLVPAVFKLFKHTKQMQVKAVAVDTMLALHEDYVTEVWLEPLGNCMSSTDEPLSILAGYAVQKLGMADMYKLPDWFGDSGCAASTAYEYLKTVVKNSELRNPGYRLQKLREAGYSTSELSEEDAISWSQSKLSPGSEAEQHEFMIEQSIGSSGGQIGGAHVDITIDVPAGAIEAPQLFAIRKVVAEDEIRELMGARRGDTCSAMYELQPAGLSFARKVIVRMVPRASQQCGCPSLHAIRMVRRTEGDTDFKPLTSFVEDGQVCAEMGSFCYVFLRCCYPRTSLSVSDVGDDFVELKALLCTSRTDLEQTGIAVSHGDAYRVAVQDSQNPEIRSEFMMLWNHHSPTWNKTFHLKKTQRQTETAIIKMTVDGQVVASCKYNAASLIHELKQENEDLMRALWQACPTADDPPGNTSKAVLQKALELCWQYSMNGIEGHRAGHIIAIGPASKILDIGTVRGRNHYEFGDPCYIDGGGSDEVLIAMNQDGAHVINGADGRIVASKFFADAISTETTGGGAGAAAAQGIANAVPDSVVFKISSDGSVKEFRAGKCTTHSAKKPLIKPSVTRNSAALGGVAGDEGRWDRCCLS